MVNYSKGNIYKLCCNDSIIKDIYVGSATNFSRRKSGHKSYCNNPNNIKYNYHVYKFIRENGGWCECGCEVSRNHISGHKKTQKHKDVMNEQ
jgi:hypothetical protein